MRFIAQVVSELQPFEFSTPTPWPSPIIKLQDLKLGNICFAITQNPEYWQHYKFLAGSPFDPSDAESDSECDDDDAHSVASLNISTIDETPYSKIASFVDLEDTGSLEMTESNALGLAFTSTEGVLGAKQIEGLPTPHYNQGDRSCDCPDQKPQDIGSQGNVSDPPGSTTFKSWPEDYKLSRICTISLPEEEEEEEEGEDLLYSGSNLGGWLTGALDGVSKIAILDCLDIGLPVPFAIW